MSGAPPDLEGRIDRLYALPLAEFIAARNELAKELRASGDRSAADEVKALAKPSVTAWAVNALYHHHRSRFDQLLEAAAAVRAALAGKGDRRKADAARRQALHALLSRATELLSEAGHAATPANRQRVSHTLETLAARDPAEDEPRAGRLVSDLEPQGFDVLAGLAASLAAPVPAATTPAPEDRPPRAKTKSASRADAARQEKLAAARRQVDELRTALARLEVEADEVAAAAKEATERHELLAEKAAEAQRRAAEAAAAAGAAKKEMAAAKTAATKTGAARRRGLSRLETARRQLERAGG